MEPPVKPLPITASQDGGKPNKPATGQVASYE